MYPPGRKNYEVTAAMVLPALFGDHRNPRDTALSKSAVLSALQNEFGGLLTIRGFPGYADINGAIFLSASSSEHFPEGGTRLILERAANAGPFNLSVTLQRGSDQPVDVSGIELSDLDYVQNDDAPPAAARMPNDFFLLLYAAATAQRLAQYGPAGGSPNAGEIHALYDNIVMSSRNEHTPMPAKVQAGSQDHRIHPYARPSVLRFRGSVQQKIPPDLPVVDIADQAPPAAVDVARTEHLDGASKAFDDVLKLMAAHINNTRPLSHEDPYSLAVSGLDGQDRPPASNIGAKVIHFKFSRERLDADVKLQIEGIVDSERRQFPEYAFRKQEGMLAKTEAGLLLFWAVTTVKKLLRGIPVPPVTLEYSSAYELRRQIAARAPGLTGSALGKIVAGFPPIVGAHAETTRIESLYPPRMRPVTLSSDRSLLRSLLSLPQQQ